MTADRDPAAVPPDAARTSVGGPNVRARDWTVGELLSWTREKFASAGIESARLDAEHLLARALGCARVDLYVRHDMLVDAQERASFRDLVKRRLTREPVAYIEGTRGFHALDLELAVDGRVLVPRPETELLVDWVLEELPAAGERGVTVLDVGTGSGAIALSLKHARPDAMVTASDVSSEALAVAESNASRHELEVTLVRADVLDGIDVPSAGFDIIVSNPPYIRTEVLAGLMPEVSKWEPTLALDGGPDGLDVVRRLVAAAADALAPGGLLYFEIGADQHEDALSLLRTHGYIDGQARRDLSGHWRIARARRPESA